MSIQDTNLRTSLQLSWYDGAIEYNCQIDHESNVLPSLESNAGLNFALPSGLLARTTGDQKPANTIPC